VHCCERGHLPACLARVHSAVIASGARCT
jgi:hypothetical protein